MKYLVFKSILIAVIIESIVILFLIDFKEDNLILGQMAYAIAHLPGVYLTKALQIGNEAKSKVCIEMACNILIFMPIIFLYYKIKIGKIK